MPEARPLAATIATLSTDQAPILNRTCLAEAPPLIILAACAGEAGRLASLLNLCTHLETTKEDDDDDGLVWLFTYFRDELTTLGRLLRSLHHEFRPAHEGLEGEHVEPGGSAATGFREADRRHRVP